ncbi:MAG: NosD domain-containing protein [Candidatus Hodarchaeota archaeon]
MKIHHRKFRKDRNRSFLLLIFCLIVILSFNFSTLLNKIQIEKLPTRIDDVTISTVFPEIWNETWGYSSQDWGTCVALDNESNIIVGGESPNSGQRHIFLVKYDSSGTQLWNKTWSKNSHDETYDIVLDSENNIYSAGRTGPYGTTGKVMLLIKFNSTGDEIWHRDWGGSNEQGARAIGLDSNEDIYVTGRASNNDTFLRKYNSSGDLQWSREWGGGGSGYENWPGVYGMTIDSEDNIYITGRTINLGPGGMDMFLLKYNTTGDLQWAETWGYSGDERGYDVELDSNNDLFVTCFSSSTNILYLIKFGSDGSQIWNRTISTFSIEGAFELDINKADMLFVAGTKPDNNQDIFLLVLDYDGGIYKYINWSLSGLESGLDITITKNSEIYMTGITNSIGAGNWDMLLIKYTSMNKFIVDQIYIDDNASGVGAHNWTWASNQFWCSGSGTISDPYVIKNLMIDANGSGSCILIENSTKAFTIEKCILFNASERFQAGIYLDNVSNGFLFNNTCSGNGRGIRLNQQSNNNIVLGNNVSNNKHAGIYLRYNCENNIISENVCKHSSEGHGIYFRSDCINNTLTKNIISYNDKRGIWLEHRSHNNTILSNTLLRNGWAGISINDTAPDNSNDNKIYLNQFIENGIGSFEINLQAVDNGNQNKWDNGTIGNYWSDYGGIDTNDDGIGDSSYSISGTAASQDNYPIWDDGPDIPTLYIDGLASGVGAQNWTWASSKTWCSGTGTFKDPYIIKDLVINGVGTDTCIDILNSDVYFVIQNCTCFNSGGGSAPFYNAGIRFYNVSNGKLIKNNCNNNQWGGIRLYYECDNNTIIYNIVNNSYNGIYLRDGCNNNSVINNICIDNSQEGMELYDNCDYNNITTNTLHSNDRTGLRINLGCDYNIIYNNTITENTQEGIRFVSACIGNTIYKNNISNNPGTGLQLDSNTNVTLIYHNEFVNNTIQAHDSGTNNQWDNGIIGNYWSDYGGDDANDNGIGDVPYDNITGSVGNQDNYPIWEDGDDLFPSILILEPTPYQLFEINAPDFTVEITDRSLHTMWYTLDNGLNNFTFTSNESIYQPAWNLKSNGTVTIIFYANDTVGHTSSKEVIVRKDIDAPEISILNPSLNDIFKIAPAYEVTVVDGNLDKIWYTLNDGENYFIDTELTGIINQELWDELPNGYVTIKFYANDTFGHLDFDEVIVVKDAPTPGKGTIPSYNLFVLLGIISLMALIVIKFKLNK